MLKKYIIYIDQHLKPEHYQKMTLAVMLFCVLSILLGPPEGLSTIGKDNSQESPVSLPQKVVFEQIPPPELPYFVKE